MVNYLVTYHINGSNAGPLPGASPVVPGDQPASPFFDLTPDYDTYTYSQDWIWHVTPPGGATSPPSNGQLRDLVVSEDGTKAIAVGGGTTGAFAAGTFDNDYKGSGGTPGGGTPHDIVIFCFNTSDGSVAWATRIGGDTYCRDYGIEIWGSYVVVAGRGGSDYYTTSGVYQETFQGDSNPATGVYGEQNPSMATLNLSDGTLVASTFIQPTPNAGGYFRDVAVAPDGTFYGAMHRHGSGSPTIGSSVIKIDSSLAGPVTLIQLGPTAAALGGEPVVRYANDYVWSYLGTSLASPEGATAGAYDESHVGGGTTVAYISKLDPSDLSVVAATYLDYGTGVDLASETHAMDLGHNDIVVTCFQCAGPTAPLTTDPIFSTTEGSASCVLTILDSALENVLYCSLLHTQGTGEAKALDSVKAGPGGRVLLGVETNSTTFQTRDGSTNTGGARAALWVVAPNEDGNYWLEFSAYVEDHDSQSRAVGWLPNGDFLVAGISDNNAEGINGPFVAKYGRSAATPTFSHAVAADITIESPYDCATMGITNKATIAMRVRTTRDANWTIYEHNASRQKVLMNTAGKLFVWLDGGTATQSADGVIANNTWQNLRFVIDGAAQTFRVYVNETLVATDTSTGAETFLSTDELRFFFNLDTGYDVEYLKVWNTAETDGSEPTTAPVKVLRGYGDLVTEDAWVDDSGGGVYT